MVTSSKTVTVPPHLAEWVCDVHIGEMTLTLLRGMGLFAKIQRVLRFPSLEWVGNDAGCYRVLALRGCMNTGYPGGVTLDGQPLPVLVGGRIEMAWAVGVPRPCAQTASFLINWRGGGADKTS